MSGHPSAEEIREQLERLQRNSIFEKSERLMVFLRHIIEASLRGQSALLTESGVGKAVYGHVRDYDARIDSTVRVEARRLRRKLTEYYAGPGKADSVQIGLPLGSYLPTICRTNPSANQGSDAPAHAQPIFKKGLGAALAVLPLQALSHESGEETFAEGLTHELIFSLSRAPGMRVLASSAVAQALKQNLSLSALAAELAVDAVFQGTVRTDGTLMRVTFEVADPKGFIVWSDRIDIPDGERLRLQELVAATILSRVRLDSSQMRAQLIGPGPVALAANAKVYSARQLLDQQTPNSLRLALKQFNEVAASAPDYARGHSGIADCYCDMYRMGLLDQATAERAARNAALRALSIDPHSIEGRAALATVCGWLEWNRFAAAEHFRAALANGESSRATRAYGVLLTLLGRHDEAEHLLWEARQMEPFSMQQDIAETLSRYQSRRFADAIATVAQLPSTREPVEALVYAALSHCFSGDAQSARGLLARISQRVAQHPDIMHAPAEIKAWLGDPSEAMTILARPFVEGTRFARATLAASAQNDAGTVESLAEALHRRELSAVWLRSDRRFDRLRGTKPFEALLAELNRLTVERFSESSAAS